MEQKAYLSIDLKSFFASVECVERGLDPLNTNLVVADASRTDKTICLAVTPSLKSFGISGRARLFEVKQKVQEVNFSRQYKAPHKELTGSSYLYSELMQSPELAVDFIIAPPRMAYYIDYSTRIYDVYLKYVAPEDIVAYSIDEVFIDATGYLKTSGLTAHDFAMRMILDILRTTGITATAGIGSNLYLCKVAMDVVAKKIPPDEHGVRIAELDEMSYRKTLWEHRPITDFWRVGKGYAKRLADRGLFTMGDVARCSVYNEDVLYKMLGVNAELLIDHAWGWEPCTIADIKSYKPSTSSICSGQVLECPYPADKARLVVREMVDSCALDLVDKKLMTNQITLTIGYDIENLTDPNRRNRYRGDVVRDTYGRLIPKHSHGTANLTYTSSSRKMTEAVTALYDRIVNPDLLIRRLTLSINHVLDEDAAAQTENQYEQLNLFDNLEQVIEQEQADRAALEKEKKMQKAMLAIKKKFGKNAILKGMNLEEGATAKNRNDKIGGHKA